MEPSSPIQCLNDKARGESDQSLIEQFRAGREDAFDQLVRKHQQRAFNLAFQVLRNHEDANEIAQDAFVKVYLHLKDFRGESAFTTWLYQIVTNLARNRLRYHARRHRDDSVPLDGADRDDPAHPPLQVPDPRPTPAQETALADQTRAIETAMNRLSAAHREILALRVIEDLSYEEIAQALECSLGTVKSRLARAREELIKILKELT